MPSQSQSSSFICACKNTHHGLTRLFCSLFDEQILLSVMKHKIWRFQSFKLVPLIQAGIGGTHFPWRHLEMAILLLMWKPGSQKKRMELLWGKPWQGDGSQRKPPCSGTRGWVQLLSLPAETQNTEMRAGFLHYFLPSGATLASG